jgi:hypothetical protein
LKPVCRESESFTPDSALAANLAKAHELFGCPDREYELREFLKASGIFQIYDLTTQDDLPAAIYECGSVRLEDTPKTFYRAMFLFHPISVSFETMYKTPLLTLVSPDRHLVATLEFYKYELALYFMATKEHIEGRGSNVICGLPGSDNGVHFKGEIAEAWFGLITKLLNREWMVYGGNDFAV